MSFIHRAARQQKTFFETHTPGFKRAFDYLRAQAGTQAERQSSALKNIFHLLGEMAAIYKDVRSDEIFRGLLERNMTGVAARAMKYSQKSVFTVSSFLASPDAKICSSAASSLSKAKDLGVDVSSAYVVLGNLLHENKDLMRLPAVQELLLKAADEVRAADEPRAADDGKTQDRRNLLSVMGPICEVIESEDRVLSAFASRVLGRAIANPDNQNTALFVLNLALSSRNENTRYHAACALAPHYVKVRDWKGLYILLSHPDKTVNTVAAVMFPSAVAL